MQNEAKTDSFQMTEMSGLGIVVEEQEYESTPAKSEEALLPPLPENALDYGHRVSTVSLPLTFVEQEVDVESDFIIDFSKNLTACAVDPEKMDDFFKETSSQVNTQSLIGSSSEYATGSSGGSSSSPLKRLKSIKKGLRKLSLSKASPVSCKSNLIGHESTSLLESISDASNVTRHFRSNTSTRTSVDYTPLTPPLTSPIITLSENLQSSKKNISNIEHLFFESIQSIDYNRVKSISDLKSLLDLIGYLHFLNHLKTQVIEAYELTRSRLQECGWCSEDDLNNLQLQQDTSLSQLDRKLLEVERRLNIDFNTSIFSSDMSLDKKSSFDTTAKVLTPTLKALESRYFSLNDA